MLLMAVPKGLQNCYKIGGHPAFIICECTQKHKVCWKHLNVVLSYIIQGLVRVGKQTLELKVTAVDCIKQMQCQTAHRCELKHD